MTHRPQPTNVTVALLAVALLASALPLPVAAQEPRTPPATPAAEAAAEPAPEPGQVADPALGLDAILERHLALRLPDEPVQTVVGTGQLVFMGLQVPLTVTIARPRSSRLEADLAGSPMILAFDGENGWTVSPLQGIVAPEALEEEAEEAIALFAEFIWGLLDGTDEEGVEVSLRGIEKVGNDETYALELSGPYQRTLYLGGQDFLEHRLNLRTVFMGVEQEIDAMLGDYRDVDGLQVPHDIRLLSAGAPLAGVVLRDVKTNVPVDAALFEQPPPPPPPAAEPEPGADAEGADDGEGDDDGPQGS